MNLWPFTKKQQSPRVKALEEEVRKERGTLAGNIVKVRREDFQLDQLVRQHLALLHGDSGETHT